MKEVRSELVRIDSKGQAHPIGATASQRLRAREGAFRLLPSPRHVVLMRYTGEDGKRDAADGAIVRLAGELTRPGEMGEILSMVAQAGWRGELCVFEGDDQRSLFFDQGSVVGVETTAENERLATVLYRHGAISKADYERLLKQIAPGVRAGSAAIDLGLIKQEEAFKYLRKQIEEVVYSTLICSDGTFFFLDDFAEARLTSRQVISANALLMEGVTRLDEIRYFREKIPSPEYVPRRNADTETPPPAEFSETWSVVDGQQSIEELGRSTGRGEFAITRDVYALIQSRHVQLTPPRLSGGLTALVAIANDALRHLHRAARERGRQAELSSGLASFASGAGLYDMLFRAAGPDSDGAFDAERVAENVVLVAQDDQGLTLRQMLYEYVGFALFSCGAMLGREVEDELKRQLGPLVARLQPPG